MFYTVYTLAGTKNSILDIMYGILTQIDEKYGKFRQYHM